MPRQKGYSTVQLPNELLRAIDDFLQTNQWGVKTRPEVVKAAVREFLVRHRELDRPPPRTPP